MDNLPKPSESEAGLPDLIALGRDVLAHRARQLGPATGRGLDDVAAAHAFAGGHAPRTVRAYALGQRRFVEWCDENGVPYQFPAHAVTPEALALFIEAMSASGLKPASISNYVAAVAAMHRAIDLPSPADAGCVRSALKQMRRDKGTAQGQAVAVRRHEVDTALNAMGDSLIDLRDAALIALAYDTGGRADNLVAFNVGDLSISDDHAQIRLARSKTDQEGRGRYAAVMPDTLARLQSWIVAAGLDREGADAPLFKPLSRKDRGERLTRRDVARIFAKRVKDSASAHSFRVGVAQDMRAAGFVSGQIAQALGWKGEAMVARYTEHMDVKDGAAARLARLQGRA